MKLNEIITSDLSIYHMVNFSHQTFFKKKLLFFKAYLDIDFRIVFWFRIYNYFYKRKFRRLATLCYFRIKSRYSTDIHPTAIIGPGLRLMHGFNIVIGPNVIIGRCCKIFNGVTLGKSRPDSIEMLMPEVGNYCILGTGAKILGKRSIADCSIVGANYVTRRSKNLDGKQDPLIKNVHNEYIQNIKKLNLN